MSRAAQDRSAPRYWALRHLIVARLREFCREPESVFWVYVFPLLLMGALGIAFRNRPVEQLAVLVEQGPNAESFAATLADDSRFRVAVSPRLDCLRQLRVGKADVVVRGVGDSASHVRYLLDPTRPGSQLARNVVDDALQRAAGRRDALAVDDEEFSEAGGRYIDFLVPGMIGMGIMGGGLWGVGFAIVDLRIRKLLKRYLATPMKRSDFLLALMISRLLFTIPEILVLLVFSRFAFGVVNHGSYLAIGLLVLCGTFEFAGIGLLVASRAKTLETVSGLMNLVMLPMWMASGIFFSYERFPEVTQPLIRLLPLTPLIDGLRAIMQEGAPLTSLTGELTVIGVWGLLSFLLALRLFRWN